MENLNFTVVLPTVSFDTAELISMSNMLIMSMVDLNDRGLLPGEFYVLHEDYYAPARVTWDAADGTTYRLHPIDGIKYGHTGKRYAGITAATVIQAVTELNRVAGILNSATSELNAGISALKVTFQGGRDAGTGRGW